MDPVTISGYADVMPLVITDHAYWRAAERFPFFDTVEIEDEIRQAIRARRISHDRRVAGLSAGWVTTDDRFVWTEDGERVYVLRMFPERAVVLTTMRRKDETT